MLYVSTGDIYKHTRLPVYMYIDILVYLDDIDKDVLI